VKGDARFTRGKCRTVCAWFTLYARTRRVKAGSACGACTKWRPAIVAFAKSIWAATEGWARASCAFAWTVKSSPWLRAFATAFGAFGSRTKCGPLAASHSAGLSIWCERPLLKSAAGSIATFRALSKRAIRANERALLECASGCTAAFCALAERPLGSNEWPLLIPARGPARGSTRPLCARKRRTRLAAIAAWKRVLTIFAEARSLLFGDACFLGQQQRSLWPARLQLAFSCKPQSVQFVQRKLAKFSRLNVKHQRTVSDAADLLNEVAGGREHFADLAIAAFNKDHFVPGIVAWANLADGCGCGANFLRTGFAFFNGHAPAQALEFVGRKLARDFDDISFFNA
jgi:hypothetical protein